MTPTRVAVLLLAVCLSLASLPAQAKPTPPVKPPDVDRDLFMLYAIEEFYRDTRLASPVTPPVGTTQFNRFIQTRRGLVDKLYTHLKEVPARKPLATELTTYRVLLGKAEEMNRKAQEVDAKYRGEAEKLYLRVERELKFKRNEDYAFDTLPSMARAARSARWGWVPDRSGRAWWFHENPAQLAFLAGYIKTLQSNVKQDRLAYELFSEAQRKETKYWETARPRMESEIKEVVAAYAEPLDGLRKAGAASLRQTAEGLAKAKKWPAGEVALDPDRPAADIPLAERPRDPFPYVWRARQAAAPTLDKPDTLDDAHDAAKQVRFVGFHMVPDELAYRPFKALAFEVGGQVALATAAAETGGYGIPTAPKKDSAAATARDCWEQYQNNTGGAKLVDSMRLLHQIVMSYAYSGGASPNHTAFVKIHDFLRSPNWKGTEDPDIWYDFARVCAMETNERPRGSKDLSPYGWAVWCLQRARMYGFDRVGEAKGSADFAKLQASGEAVKKAFDLALEQPPIRASKR